MEDEELKTVENTEQNKEEKKDNKFVSFLKNAKGILMKTTNGMSIGLFGTLIIGTVIALFAKIPGLEQLNSWASIIQGLMGAGIGLGVGLALKRDGIAIVTLMAAGFVGNYAWEWLAFKEIISNCRLPCKIRIHYKIIIKIISYIAILNSCY